MSMGYNRRPKDYGQRKDGFYRHVDYPLPDGSHYIFVPYRKFGGDHRNSTSEITKRREQRSKEENNRAIPNIKGRYVKTSLGEIYTGPKYLGVPPWKEEEQRKKEEARKEEERRIEERKAKLAKKSKKKEERKNKRVIFFKNVADKCKCVFKTHSENDLLGILSRIDNVLIQEKLIEIMKMEKELLCADSGIRKKGLNKFSTLMIIVACLLFSISLPIGAEFIALMGLLYTSNILIYSIKKNKIKHQRLDAIKYLNVKLEENILKNKQEEIDEKNQIKIKNLKILKLLNDTISVQYENNYNNKICYKNLKSYFKLSEELNNINTSDVNSVFEDKQDTIEHEKTLIKKYNI